MDIALVFFLPLVGGYIFSAAWNVTKFRVAREDGHRLYFRAAFYAAFLFAIAYLFRLLAIATIPEYGDVDKNLSQAIGGVLKDPVKAGQGEIVLVSIYALALGAGLWAPFNVLFGQKIWHRLAINGNDFELLLLKAANRSTPVCISTDNDKIYIGLVARLTGGIGDDRKWVSIHPMISGYRRDDDKKMMLTTFYEVLYKGADPKSNRLASPLDHLQRQDFEIAFPVSKICSLNLFDLVAYEEFEKAKAATQDELPQTAQAAPPNAPGVAIMPAAFLLVGLAAFLALR